MQHAAETKAAAAASAELERFQRRAEQMKLERIRTEAEKESWRAYAVRCTEMREARKAAGGGTVVPDGYVAPDPEETEAEEVGITQLLAQQTTVERRLRVRSSPPRA